MSQEFFAYKDNKLVQVTKEEYDAMTEQVFAELREALIAYVPASEQDVVDDRYSDGYSLTSKIPVEKQEELHRINQKVAFLRLRGYSERIFELYKELGI